jgi:hypothetical protein
VGAQRGWEVVGEADAADVQLQWAKARDVNWSRVLDGYAPDTDWELYSVGPWHDNLLSSPKKSPQQDVREPNSVDEATRSRDR